MSGRRRTLNLVVGGRGTDVRLMCRGGGGGGRGLARGGAAGGVGREGVRIEEFFYWDNVSIGGGVRVCCKLSLKLKTIQQHTRTPLGLRNSIRVHFQVGADRWREMSAQRAEQVGSTRRGQMVKARVELEGHVKSNGEARGCRRRRVVNGIRSQAARPSELGGDGR